MKIYPMSELEYKTWGPRSRALYASTKMKANGFSKEAAEKIAQAEFERNLPNRMNSKDSYFYTAKDEHQNVIGFAWLLIRGVENDRRAFIGDIIIEKQYRGKGNGKSLMLLLENEVRKLGLQRIGLHVFGDNDTAIRLYRSLGYSTTDLVMEKLLPT